jgi:hypothetical protein
MTASMNYSHYNDLGLLDAEVDSEGKARHQGTASIAMYYGISQRLFGNKLKSRKRFVQELVPQAFALLLVP